MASFSAMPQPLKYPKTPHLPFSPGVQDDDTVLSPVVCGHLPVLLNEAVVTEKLDGGNCCIYQGKVYARTVGCEASHPSFGPIKQLAAQISYQLPDNIQLFGENMFGIHSIEYDRLESYFYVFAVLRDGSQWLPWDEITELSEELGLITVPVVARQKFSLEEVEKLIRTRMKKESCCDCFTFDPNSPGICNPEGFVVRTVSGFPYSELERHVAKFVRPGHVQTDENWRRTWKQARLRKE